MTKRKPVKGKAIPHAVKRRAAHGNPYIRILPVTTMTGGNAVGIVQAYDPKTGVASVGLTAGTPVFASSGYIASPARQGLRVPTPKPPALRPWLCRVLGWHDWGTKHAWSMPHYAPKAEHQERCDCGCGQWLMDTGWERKCYRCGAVESRRLKDGRQAFRETRFCARTHKAFNRDV